MDKPFIILTPQMKAHNWWKTLPRMYQDNLTEHYYPEYPLDLKPMGVMIVNMWEKTKVICHPTGVISRSASPVRDRNKIPLRVSHPSMQI